MAGSPGTGKSEVASTIYSMYPDYVIIDADNVELIINSKYSRNELESKIND